MFPRGLHADDASFGHGLKPRRRTDEMAPTTTTKDGDERLGFWGHTDRDRLVVWLNRRRMRNRASKANTDTPDQANLDEQKPEHVRAETRSDEQLHTKSPLPERPLLLEWHPPPLECRNDDNPKVDEVDQPARTELLLEWHAPLLLEWHHDHAAMVDEAEQRVGVPNERKCDAPASSQDTKPVFKHAAAPRRRAMWATLMLALLTLVLTLRCDLNRPEQVRLDLSVPKAVPGAEAMVYDATAKSLGKSLSNDVLAELCGDEIQVVAEAVNASVPVTFYCSLLFHRLRTAPVPTSPSP